MRWVKLEPIIWSEVSQKGKHQYSILMHEVKIVSNSLRPHGLYGILQARILEWVAFPFSRGSSQPRDKPRSPALQADSLPGEPGGRPITPEEFI